jgi:hypothetical protein
VNFTFQTNGLAKGPLLCSKDWPKFTTILNWLKAWRVHGDENKSLLSPVKCSASRPLECNGLISAPNTLSLANDTPRLAHLPDPEGNIARKCAGGLGYFHQAGGGTERHGCGDLGG